LTSRRYNWAPTSWCRIWWLGSDGRWILSNAFRDDARVRAESFDAMELDLSILWADVVIPETL
jgi:hypothetical protein